MTKKTKKVLGIVGGVIAGAAVIGGIYVGMQVRAFDASMDKVYDIPIPAVTLSTDPAVLARGKHLAESVAACASRDCHGTDFGGGQTLHIGPLGTMTGPNLTKANLGAAYTDGELARIIHYGIKKDGRSVRFMPAQDFGWLPDADVTAIISYLRSVPNVERENGPMGVGTLAKIIDRQNKFVMDVARRTVLIPRETVPAPEPTPAYGRFLARQCSGCHGEGLSGGPIPGAPPNLPIPLNITPDETGIKGWTQADFDKLLQQGIRRNGAALNPFMPFAAFGKMDDTERKALYTYLMSLPPKPFGGR